MSPLVWFVAHTRPRREKRLKDYCERQSIAVTLPCYRAAHRYRGKTVVFHKPLFPSYVFLQLIPEQVQHVGQNDHVARLLAVSDQDLFARQLGDILLALDSGLEVFLAPQINAGSRVKIKSGPLRGMEALVEQRSGLTTVLLRLDFISQAAAIRLETSDLELL